MLGGGDVRVDYRDGNVNANEDEKESRARERENDTHLNVHPACDLVLMTSWILCRRVITYLGNLQLYVL